MRLRDPRRLTKQMTRSSCAGGNEPEEQALLHAARAGDERALGLLLDRHRSGLELYCYLALGDRAQARTALADTALAAWAERDSGEPATSARMWLYRLAVRVCTEAHPGPCDEFRVREPFERLTGDERSHSD
jgi:DNA-directed RNA polymerase specialized sigma24 family protein